MANTDFLLHFEKNTQNYHEIIKMVAYS